MHGETRTMAEVVGEAEPRPLSYTADDMAGWTEDDFEAAGLAMERDMHERLERLERENRALRAALEDYE